MSLHSREVWAAYRAKKRPCLVFSNVSPAVSKDLTHGKPKHATAPVILVAPFYGAEKTAGRAGYSEEFTERVRHGEYPQFHWEKIPKSGVPESILRIDHLQPVGAHYQAYQISDYMLSEEAMELLDDMMTWLMFGGVPENSVLLMYHDFIKESFD